MADSQRLADLSPEELEFLRRRLRKAARPAAREDEGQAPPAIPRRAAGSDAPLSFAQQRLWIIHQIEARSTAYHIPITVEVRGALRTGLLRASLTEIARRHEALRTTFARRDGQPVQVVAAELRPELPVLDLSHLPEVARQAEAARLAELHAALPFDLERGPVFRAAVLRLEPERCRLLLTLHHIAADNWSVAVLMRELTAVSADLWAGRPAALPEPPLQYADYAVWQRQWLQGEVLESQLAFWKRQLAGAPGRLGLPADRPRPPVPSFRSGRLLFTVPATLAGGLRRLARERGATLYMVLLAAFDALLYRYAGQRDFVVGSPVVNRRRSELEGLIGFFVNTLPLRSRVAGDAPFSDLLAAVREVVLEAYAHQDLPFERIVQELRPERDTTYQPLFQVMFNLFDAALPELRLPGLEVMAAEVRIGTMNDLDLLLVQNGEGLEGHFRYSVDLFEPSTMEALVAAYLAVLEQVAGDAALRPDDLRLSALLAERAEAARLREVKQTLAVAATFTAEPLEEPLAWWMSELDVPARVRFAPYNQVFQELLTPGSLLRGDRGGGHGGVNVVLLRWEDWLRYEAASRAERVCLLATAEAPAKLERNAADLVAALEQAASAAPVPWLLVLCPASPEAAEVAPFAALAAGLEERVRTDLSGLGNVHVVGGAEMADLYPVERPHDPHADDLGHIPYTPPFFTALATLIARRIHALTSPPVKVLALDCDHTLWRGVCGEDGPLGVEVDAPRRVLQELALAQKDAGLLLCLCSKNREEDVFKVFDQNPGMVLRREHLTAWRIDWQPKSVGLRALAAELGLGLDSFVVLDDNPVECAEIRAGCPEALVLQLPDDPAALPHFLRHVWAFDRLRVTEEDRRRTTLYRQNAERERFRRQAGSFADFLADLGLAVDVVPMSREELPRVSQLTWRTNQFNTTTRRRTEGEIRDLVETGALEAWTVSVRDRFGDYGLVGVLLFAPAGGALAVDSLLLSCRVLGRGVEHRMLAALGEAARERGFARVDVTFLPTPKNQPVHDFLEAVAGGFAEEQGVGAVYRLPAEVAAGLRIPGETPAVAGAGEETGGSKREAAAAPVSRVRSQKLQRIATELADVGSIRLRIEAARQQERGADGAEYVAPRTPLEHRLAAVFSELLGVDRVGIHDDFFQLGGHSLLGAQVVARLIEDFGLEGWTLQALFESPTVERLAERIGLVQAAPGSGRIPRLPRDPGAASFPLSFAQQRLWFLDRLEPGSNVYNEPSLTRLRGRLDVAALRRAVAEVLRRHETLRTAFSTDGEPLQLVRQDVEPALPRIDAGCLPEAVRESEAVRQATRLATRPFDLRHAPLLRVALFALGPEEHLLLVVFHHIIADGWSFGVFLRELATLYEAFSRGLPSPLPELPVQYADFAGWQREWLQGEVLDTQTAWWRRRLAGAPPVLNLPTDRPFPPRQSYAGTRHPLALPDEVAARLMRLAREEGAGLYATLLAAYSVLLWRFTGQADMVVGSPTAGRNRRELEPLVGFFANTLVLRNDLADAPSFRALISRVGAGVRESLVHQEIPFAKLVEELQPERTLGRSPLFQVMFTYHTADLIRPVELPGLTLSPIELEKGICQFDLTLSLWHRGEGLEGEVEYCTALFDVPTVRRFMSSFLHLAAGIAADPDRPLWALPVMGEAERCELLVEWNDTAREIPAAAGFAGLFEAQAGRTPEAVAAVCGERSLTYRELNRLANRLAHALAGEGIGAESVVPLLAERGLEFLIGILAVFKAGGAYLPLDATHPVQRHAEMLSQSGASRILAGRGLTGRLREALQLCPPDWHPGILEIEPLLEGDGDPGDPPPRSGPDNLAYVIFTSGSTGLPKGAMLVHQGMINHLQAKVVDLGLTAADRVAETASPCFDISVWQFLVALVVGGAVHILPDEVAHDPERLLDGVEASGITVLEVVPSLLRLALDEVERRGAARPALGTLRWMIPTGEALPPDLCVRWLRAYPEISLLNAYGPTECSDDVTHHPVPVPPALGEASVPIGRPLINTRLYVLDPRGEPVPVGVTGELLIGGAGVGRGYLREPRRTAEVFVPDPFGGEPGGRLYRTGDQARLLPGGTLQFLGRNDNQVKVRGVRIELAEIEAALAAHPQVRQAVVLASKAAGGELVLAAYLEIEPGGAPNVQDLRQHMLGLVPGYMIPSAFAFVAAMPLTSNGKVDRKALAAVPLEQAGPGGDYAPPESDLEEDLAGIFAELLRVERVGVFDSFFALGGHSLLATQLVSRVRRLYDVDLPLSSVFSAPTVAELAALVEGLILDQVEAMQGEGEGVAGPVAMEARGR
jgi:amino acid adenylation domain-containing protein/FkbH-like protein